MSNKKKSAFTRVAEAAASVSNKGARSKSAKDSDDEALFSSKDIPKSSKRRSTTDADGASFSRDDRTRGGRAQGDRDERRRGIPKNVKIGGIAGVLFTPWIGVGNASESVKDVAVNPTGFWSRELKKAPMLAVIAVLLVLFALSGSCSGNSVTSGDEVVEQQVVSVADSSAGSSAEVVSDEHAANSESPEAAAAYMRSLYMPDEE